MRYLLGTIALLLAAACGPTNTNLQNETDKFRSSDLGQRIHEGAPGTTPSAPSAKPAPSGAPAAPSSATPKAPDAGGMSI